MPHELSVAGAERTRLNPLPTGTVTFLFTDIEGSTRLLHESGAGYGDLLAEHRRLIRKATAEHGGREVDTQGDSFFIAFPSPAQAVAAACTAQRELARHSWPEGQEVRVRMGLHSGDATEVGGGYVSLAVHRAARIAAAAHGGQVLLSEATAGLVGDELPRGAHLHDLGEHRLKDFPRPMRLYQLDIHGLSTAFPPLRTLVRHDLFAVPAGRLLGREEEIDELAGMLRDRRTRLLTVTGVGGIGKTRLAVEAARVVTDEFPGGVVFVPLAAVVDPRLVLGTVADAFAVRHEPGTDVVEAISAAIGADRTLLVLDNFEQVAPAAADLAALLERAAEAVALVTSRQVLRLRSEKQYPVWPLPESPAVRLFEERAAAVRPGFRVDEHNAQAVAEICRRLDGLPLAIELAAARVRLLPPENLLARLDERLDVLGGGPVDMPERQRTLRATMDWSYGLLSPADQAVFARLGVFAGGCSLSAAEAVCGRDDEAPVLDTLSDLLDDSLLVTSGDAGPEPRFSMLETVRAYAAERLAVCPDREETEQRHTAWMTDLVGEMLHAHGPEYRLATERLDAERANLRAVVQRALAQGDAATVAELTRNTFAYLTQRDAEEEVVAWLDQALELPGALPDVRGRLLTVRALAAGAGGDLSAVRRLLAEARPLLADDADHAYDQTLLAVAGIYAAFPDDLEAAAACIEDATTRFAALGVEIGSAHMSVAGGNLALRTGDLDMAEGRYRAAVTLAEHVRDDALRGRALSLLGLTFLARGDVDGARQSVVDGARANRRGAQQSNMAYSLEGLAAVALADDHPLVAARALAAATAVREHIRHPLTPALPPLIAELTQRSREALGDDAFEAAWTEGRQWSVGDALDRTLEGMRVSADVAAEQAGETPDAAGESVSPRPRAPAREPSR